MIKCVLVVLPYLHLTDWFFHVLFLIHSSNPIKPLIFPLIIIGYINIDMGNTGLGSSNIAATVLPTSSGSFGTNIRINTNYTSTPLTVSAKKFAMVHELGHAIGLKHTDTSEGSAVYSGISCYGSTTYTDPNSIMKKTIPYNQAWTNFTTCDQTVINYYW